ncbi:cysteine dioxygenase family protein [Rhodococcus rhodochrous]|uniref:Cysteine dioxygenase family protein n=1 Tax=Rhodococcus rhodochrous TaxID=1829 RepID=A0AAW4XDN2_RHORH|nr:cysteine dioxygenase family protein [Rhodococcus rhodochrous]MCD2111014.1 cysteine dioxygenase family protein [Rhodococcus rhodochrous]
MPAALLSTSVRVDLAEIVRDIAADASRRRPLVRFDETERWYTRLAVADDYEVWLLSWLPGQRTGIHDHGGSAGAFAVAQGRVREDTVDQPWSEDLPGQRVTLSRTRLSTGATRRFDGRHVHEVVNDGPVPAVTVHAYAPALDSMSRYRLESGILTLATSERAGDDW